MQQTDEEERWRCQLALRLRGQVGYNLPVFQYTIAPIASFLLSDLFLMTDRLDI